MDSGGNFKYVEGCFPCSFVCSCCDRHCYRCSCDEEMWLWENKCTRETYSILCGHCYRGCPQSPYRGCEFNREQEEARWEAEQRGVGKTNQPAIKKAPKKKKTDAEKGWILVGKDGRAIK